MLPVAAELVSRGNTVRFYSFNEFKSKIENSGAEFISCDAYLPKLTKKEETELKNVSITEMTIQGIRTTLAMDMFLHNEFQSFKPDVVYTDSICFWGKLNAWKSSLHRVGNVLKYKRLNLYYYRFEPKIRHFEHDSHTALISLVP